MRNTFAGLALLGIWLICTYYSDFSLPSTERRNTLLMGLGLAGLTLYVGRGFIRAYHATRSLQEAKRVSVADLAALVAAAPDGKVYVQIRGKILPGDPLKAPLTDENCVYVHSRIMREFTYERMRHTKPHNWIRDSDTVLVAEHERRCSFAIADETGRCYVEPEGATIEAETVLDENREGEELEGVSLPLDPSAMAKGRKSRTKAFRLVEETLRAEGPITIVGYASAGPDGPELKAGESLDFPMLITRTHAAKVRQTTSNDMNIYGVATLACALYTAYLAFTFK